MNKADKAIIQAHPELSNNPHDLLTLHGLSESGFNELVAQMDDAASKGQTYKPVLKPAAILQPTITPFQPQQYTSDTVYVIPPKGGIGVEMNRRDAEQLILHNPKYKIVR